MFRISCFADEISPDLNEQIEVMKKNNVNYVELRSVWNKNVLDLSDDELDEIKKQLTNKGIKVSSIGSPIGKTDIEGSLEDHQNRFNRAIEVALKLNAPNIRIFSFYMPKEKLDFYRDAVIERLRNMVEIAEENKLILLHENEADIYGESSERCLDLFNSIPSSSFKAVFDPSNFVVAGEDVQKSFNRLKDYVEYIHVKDSIKDTGEIVLAGHGDGRIPEILNELRDKQDMFLSLEPHLAQAGKFRGFSGPALFEKALEALREILKELKIDFR